MNRFRGPGRKPGASSYTRKRLSLFDGPLSNVAFNFNLRRYAMAQATADAEASLSLAAGYRTKVSDAKVGRCRLNPG